jgi:hypothetical protein
VLTDNGLGSYLFIAKRTVFGLFGGIVCHEHNLLPHYIRFLAYKKGRLLFRPLAEGGQECDQQAAGNNQEEKNPAHNCHDRANVPVEAKADLLAVDGLLYPLHGLTGVIFRRASFDAGPNPVLVCQGYHNFQSRG